MDMDFFPRSVKDIYSRHRHCFDSVCVCCTYLLALHSSVHVCVFMHVCMQREICEMFMKQVVV